MKPAFGGLLRLVLGGYCAPRDLVRFSLRRYRQRTALIGPQGGLTYAQLEDRVYRLAQGLEMLGMSRGEPLLTLLPDGREAVETRLAAAEIGAVLAPFSPAPPPEAVRRLAGRPQPEILIYDPRVSAETAQALQAELPRLRLLPVGEGGEYERMLLVHAPRPSTSAVRAGDPALLPWPPAPPESRGAWSSPRRPCSPA